MDVTLWTAFVAASVALLAIPGPTVMLVLSYALSQGRRVALACAAGVATGDFIALSASLAGLGALVAASATAFTLLKWAGALYLIWLGWRLLRSAPEASDSGDPDPAQRPASAPSGLAASSAPRPVAQVFRNAATVTALNPKSIAFFVAFVPQFVDPARPYAPQVVILIATFVMLAAGNALLYAVAADRLRSRIARPATLVWLSRGGGAALIGMGVLTATLRRAS